MTSTARRTRQYRVTHIPTGIVTVVQSWAYHCEDGHWDPYYEGAANKAGLRYPFNASVSLVPIGQEIPLPFDEISLVLRPNKRGAA